ncbi:MAG: FAD-dependent oxidoreductase [Rhizobiales bacterium]|nr:FAD-dependent oxidoreductase [Hyphomicrobiales bacterium]
MATELPKSARCVIIGGGVAGCSVAYHLAKLGWKDVVLLERKQLTSGTTWHAAGLISQGRMSPNVQRLSMYSADLYESLEAETGISTGMKRNGSLLAVKSAEREDEVRRLAAAVNMNGLETHMLSPKECLDKYPLLNVTDLRCGMFIVRDGQADPANVALAMAKGARQAGARLIEGVKVTGIKVEKGRVRGVTTDQGAIETDIVVNCGGMWGREVGAMAGVATPLQACEHFYIVTEPIADLPRNLPVLRAPEECAYYKEDAGKILLGAFEPVAKPWGMKGIPEDFCFDQLPEDFEHFEPILEMAVKRLPVLATAGIHTFFNGPESFTPDDRWLMGEAPGVGGFWMLCGFNSIGIVSSGGAGKALAEWMDAGEAPFDLWDFDIRRIQGFQANRTYLEARVTETLGLLYADHFPYRQFASARGVRRTPLHDRLEGLGACFGETAGWERANWFLPPGRAASGEKPAYEYSWGRQNWFAHSGDEHKAVREAAGLFDLSSFGKIRVEGRDAEAVLQRVSANDMAVEPGRIVYTQWLNRRGGVEADVTVTRLSETLYIVVTPAATVRRDLDWLKRHIPDEAHCIATDVTAGEGVIAVMGPKSREVLSQCTPADLSNAAFPFGTAREIELGMGLVRAHRISYVGELGWELYASADQARHVLDCLLEKGVGLGLRPAGLHALDSCRIEKAYRHFGHDMSDEDHVLEAGLGFAVKADKKASRFGDFIGREAVLRRRQEGLTRRMLQFRLTDPEPLVYHFEPIYRDGALAGYVTSGNYGHHLGGAIAMGYVSCERGESDAQVLASRYEVDVAGRRVAAEASLKPMYDPTSARVRA